MRARLLKRRTLLMALVALLSVGTVLAAAIAAWERYLTYFTLERRVSQGEFMTSSRSPAGTWDVELFVVGSWGPFSSGAVRAQVRRHADPASRWRTCFLGLYRETSADVSWRDENVVLIFGHPLDVRSDSCDMRFAGEGRRWRRVSASVLVVLIPAAILVAGGFAVRGVLRRMRR